MSKFTTYTIRKDDKQALTNKIPNKMQSKLLSYYIVNHYTLPENVDAFFEKVETDRQGFTLSTQAFERLQELRSEVNEANKISIDNSKLMRDIIKNFLVFLDHNRDLFKSKKNLHAQRFLLPKGTKNKFRNLTDQIRNTALENYILNEYTPNISNIMRDASTKEENEEVFIKMDYAAFEKLDEHKKNINESKSRSSIMRDVIRSFFQQEKEKLENDLFQAMKKYEIKYGKEELKASIENYFSNDK